MEDRHRREHRAVEGTEAVATGQRAVEGLMSVERPECHEWIRAVEETVGSGKDRGL